MASIASPRTKRTSSLAVIATDGELLMRFRRHRDEAAFAEVVERHGRLVWVVCKQTLSHHQDVEDAFQATFFILAQRANTIHASESAAAWLYRVAQRTAIAARRRRSKLREEELTVEPPQGEEALPVIQDRQMLRVLMEELKALPQRYQTPLVMQYFEGQSRRAIAEQTDSTLAQIQGRLVRGKRMLRSRLMRRGVSLSLAAGAVAAANTTASAAVSPSLVAATAASSSSFLTSGATGSATPAAAELSKQGLNAMWYASLTKTVGTAAGVLIVAGVLFAAQSGDDGLADATVGQAVNGVDLQATVAAVTEEEEPAAIAIAAAEPAKVGGEPPEPAGPLPPNTFVPASPLELEQESWLLKAKAYRMKAAQMRELIKRQAVPTITEADAMLLEADAAMAEVKAMELAREAAARKASGGSSPTAGEVSAGEVRVFSLRYSDASDLVLMLQEQFGAGPLKFSADARTNRIIAKGTAADLAVVQALLTRLDTESDQQPEHLAKQRDKNERKIKNLRILLSEYSTVRAEAELERERLEQAFLQKELEQLHEIYMQLNSPHPNLRGKGGLPVAGESHESLKREIQESMDEKKARLEERRKQIVDLTRGLEKDQRERAGIERKLEYLEKANLQLEFPQETVPVDSNEVRHLRANQAMLEAELKSVRAENEALKKQFGELRSSDPTKTDATLLELELENSKGEIAILRATMEEMEKSLDRAFQERDALRQENEQLKSQVEGLRGVTTANEESVIGPGDTIEVSKAGIVNALTSTKDYTVEPTGTVALGPTAGRVKVAGMTLVEAGVAIEREMRKEWKGASVQVTMKSKAETQSGNTFKSGDDPAIVAELEKLRKENEILKDTVIKGTEQSVDEMINRSILAHKVRELQDALGVTFPDQTEDPRTTIVGPSDTLRIEAVNVFPEAPISGEYRVEPEGTVALGARYGRVDVAGLTVLESEERIQRHLEKTFEKPSVQVTMQKKPAALREASARTVEESNE